MWRKCSTSMRSRAPAVLSRISGNNDTSRSPGSRGLLVRVPVLMKGVTLVRKLPFRTTCSHTATSCLSGSCWATFSIDWNAWVAPVPRLTRVRAWVCRSLIATPGSRKGLQTTWLAFSKVARILALWRTASLNWFLFGFLTSTTSAGFTSSSGCGCWASAWAAAIAAAAIATASLPLPLGGRAPAGDPSAGAPTAPAPPPPAPPMAATSPVLAPDAPPPPPLALKELLKSRLGVRAISALRAVCCSSSTVGMEAPTGSKLPMTRRRMSGSFALWSSAAARSSSPSTASGAASCPSA